MSHLEDPQPPTAGSNTEEPPPRNVPVSAMPMLRMGALCFWGKSSAAALKAMVPSSRLTILKMRMVSPLASQVMNALQGQVSRGGSGHEPRLNQHWTHLLLLRNQTQSVCNLQVDAQNPEFAKNCQEFLINNPKK